MDRTKLVTLISCAGIITLFSAYGLLQAIHPFNSEGTVATIGIEAYTDPAKTTFLTYVDWGVFYPNMTKTHNMYLYNNGSIPVTLTMTTDEWNPTIANQFLHVTWNATGYLLQAQHGVPIQFAIFVLPNVTGVDSFSFTTIITGAQA